MQNQKIYREISLRPKTTQFLVDELPLLAVCIIGIIYGGMKDAPLAPVAILFAVLLSLYLTYRFIYLKRIRYHVWSEQLTAEQGVFQRSIGYMELYRVVDFHEHQTLLQQIFGLKTITVLSMDRTTPKLELIGLPKQNHIVNIIRERSQPHPYFACPGLSIPGLRSPPVSPQFCHAAVQESQPVIHRLRLSTSP